MSLDHLRHATSRSLDMLEVPLAAIDRVVSWALAAFLLVIAAVLFFNAIGRTLGFSYLGGSSLARLLVIWLTYLGSYLVVRSNTHIVIDVVPKLIPAAWRSRLQALVGLIGALTCGYLAWLGYTYTSMRFASGQVDELLSISSGYFYLPVPVGGALMAFGFFIMGVRTLVTDAEPGANTATRSAEPKSGENT